MSEEMIPKCGLQTAVWAQPESRITGPTQTLINQNLFYEDALVTHVPIKA